MTKKKALVSALSAVPPFLPIPALHQRAWDAVGCSFVLLIGRTTSRFASSNWHWASRLLKCGRISCRRAASTCRVTLANRLQKFFILTNQVSFVTYLSHCPVVLDLLVSKVVQRLLTASEKGPHCHREAKQYNLDQFEQGWRNARVARGLSRQVARVVSSIATLLFVASGLLARACVRACAPAGVRGW
eukprot:5977873-Pleurochrysis_carterae.AAC.1